MKQLAVALMLIGHVAAGHAIDLASAIEVREIRIEGNRLIPQSILDATLPAYRNRAVRASELQQLAQQLTAYLVEHGFVSSGVIVPDQKVEDGIVHLQVVEGRLSSTELGGRTRLRDSYITGRLGGINAEPLNVQELAARLQLLQLDPRIERIDASIKPGLERGAAVLHLDVVEAGTFGFSVGADNQVSPNVGEHQLTAEVHHSNVLGFGDTLQLAYGAAEGFDSGYLSYTLPIGSQDTSVRVFFETNTSEIVSEPFASLGIEGDSTRIGAELRHPFIRTLNTELALALGIEAQKVRSYLLGEPFSFSAGTSEGTSQVTVATFSQEWVRREPHRVLAMRSTLNFGLDALDATIGGEADGDFFYWLGQAQWLEKIPLWDSTVALKLQGRVANDVLPGYRKYSLGGAESVRGYRENLFVRDQGAVVSLEWSMPLAHFALPMLSRESNDGELRITSFVDYGYGQDYLEDVTNPVDLWSIGVGFQWQISQRSRVELQFAKALIDHIPAAVEKVLQDEGVHISARIGW